MNTKIIINKNKNLLINFSLNGGIDIYVDGGNLTEPYYQFYSDSNGETTINKLDVSIGKTYTFYRLNDADSHPFYISDTGYKQSSSNKITLSGDGDNITGITSSESFTVTFNENIENLYYFCTTHSSMLGHFKLISDYSKFLEANGKYWASMYDILNITWTNDIHEITNINIFKDNILLDITPITDLSLLTGTNMQIRWSPASWLSWSAPNVDIRIEIQHNFNKVNYLTILYKTNWAGYKGNQTFYFDNFETSLSPEILDLNVGWNLIGSSRNCQILDEEDIVEENTLYEFNESYTNTYTNVTTLKSNEGYYVFAKSAGTIKLVPL